MSPPVTLAPASGFNLSHDDIQRFNGVATILDEAGFARTLTAFILEKFQSIKSPAPSNPEADLLTQLQTRAKALRAETRWQADARQLQRARVQMLKEFNTPNNLPLAQFAKLANKSRQQIYKNVAAKRLLALVLGSRGLRIPDWQLDPMRLELTRRLMAKAVDIDEWTVFHALALPLDSLQGKSAVEALHKSNFDAVLSTVLNDLGLID